jgi:hypothetical protein
MKITRKQLKKLILESWGTVNTPVAVSNNTNFFWSARQPELVHPGFKVPISGPIQDAMEIEKIYEEVRQEINPTAPSRFNCVYVCPTLNGFCKKQASSSRTGGVFRVRVSGKVFFTDAEYWTEGVIRSQRYKNMDEARSWANSYWEGMSQQDATMVDPDMAMYSYYEVLVDGTVEVLERLF